MNTGASSPDDLHVLRSEYAIRQLYARLADAVARQDIDLFATCFAADAEWKVAGIHLLGRKAITEAFGKLIASSNRVLISHGTPVLEIGANTGTGRLTVSEIAWRKTGKITRAIGVYYDQYTGNHFEWQFANRFWGLAYSGPADFSAPLIPSPDYGPHPGRPHPDEQAPTPENWSFPEAPHGGGT